MASERYSDEFKITAANNKKVNAISFMILSSWFQLKFREVLSNGFHFNFYEVPSRSDLNFL